MNTTNKTRLEKEGPKLFVLFSLIGLCCFITFYSSFVLNTTSVYTHLFYIPIFLTSLWWEKKGIPVVILLSIFLIIAYIFSPAGGISFSDYLRIGVIFFVGIFMSLSLDLKIRVNNISIIDKTSEPGQVIIREPVKIIFITALIFLSCILTVYFHVIENRGTVFSHFFYIPIILSALWWKRRGLAVALFLASFLLFGHFFLRDYVITINDYFRAVMFIIVPLFISYLGEKISNAEKQISYLDLIVSLAQNVNRLVMHEIDGQRLSEGIASTIANSPGCNAVAITLSDQKGTAGKKIIRYSDPAMKSLLTLCHVQALKNSRQGVTSCRECKGCNAENSVSFSHTLEYDEARYGIITFLLSVEVMNDTRQIDLLKSISDELAYALYNLDVEKKRKHAEEKHRLDELRLKTIYNFTKITGSSFREMTLFALQEAISISKSKTGYIAFINKGENRAEIVTTGRSDERGLKGSRCFRLHESGKLSTVTSSESYFITEEEKELKSIAGLYEDHDLSLRRHMDIPIFDNERIVAVVGLGNKKTPYEDSDIRNIGFLMQGMWIILKHKQTEDELAVYRDHLKEMVKSRTEELERANERLTVEIKERNILYKNLEASTRELGSFVHTVTHDLKSPLYSMELCADMLNKNHSGQLDENGLELLQQLKKETVRMEELIKDVLNLSRIGFEPENIEEIDIIKLIFDISRRFGYYFEENSVEFVVKISVPEPLPVIEANRSQVIQVFENLITNAVKFMGDQPDPCVVICCDSIENNLCRFYVEDNGIGIAENNHDKIFAEFYRTHDSDVDGTGIGLAIVKKVVEKHGGEISLSSQPGRGSTFYFSLPVKPALCN
ncbi:MAG TPA: ATP-binding protein [Spirochaetota bacterium]|nr:ATP-binding protein [Spirochaetota bacterium]HPJ33710.1 ATP-binding protein [Spirochaetota bacterium]